MTLSHGKMKVKTAFYLVSHIWWETFDVKIKYWSLEHSSGVSSSLLHVLYSHKYFFKLCRFSFSYMQQKLSVTYLHEYKLRKVNISVVFPQFFVHWHSPVSMFKCHCKQTVLFKKYSCFAIILLLWVHHIVMYSRKCCGIPCKGCFKVLASLMW